MLKLLVHIRIWLIVKLKQYFIHFLKFGYYRKLSANYSEILKLQLQNLFILGKYNNKCPRAISPKMLYMHSEILKLLLPRYVRCCTLFLWVEGGCDEGDVCHRTLCVCLGGAAWCCVLVLFWNLKGKEN